MEEILINRKLCINCNEWKFFSEFHKGRCSDGFNSYCKKCVSEYKKEYRKKIKIK